jgi:pyruvate formate lyase activating enzyme
MPTIDSQEHDSAGLALGRWHHRLDDGRIQCDLCPRYCRLHEGQRAFCFVRQRVGDQIYLTSYGKATGFCIDPIEKKPLNHFHPGTSVLSFGTAGCNLGCRFCQNWDISKAREIERLSDAATPEQVAQAALDAGCRSVAFTYNDPVIFAEYAIDAARACRERGVKTVAVTAGYITREARADFFSEIDAANVDLKAFTEQFYHKLCFAQLAPVLDTLRWLNHQPYVWFEVTTILIRGKTTPSKRSIGCATGSSRISVPASPYISRHFTPISSSRTCRTRHPKPAAARATRREPTVSASCTPATFTTPRGNPRIVPAATKS